MQVFYILRGCFTAYACAVLIIGGSTMIFSGGGFGVLGVTAIFGLFGMIPFTVIALVLWSALAQAEKRIRALHAIAICTAVFFGFSILAGLMTGEFLEGIVVVLLSPLLGAAFGIAFWVGAFGFRREMTMGWRVPESA